MFAFFYSIQRLRENQTILFPVCLFISRYMVDFIQILPTEDGSHTLRNKVLNETYHSIHGAITESVHVFLEYGLKSIHKTDISIFEVGFGTGLNAFLTLDYFMQHDEIVRLNYDTIEKYPIESDVFQNLNFPNLMHVSQEKFLNMHHAPWDEPVEIVEGFSLNKGKGDLLQCNFGNKLYDVIYFDAFSPDTQPEMWSVDIFKTLFQHVAPGGILTTYCAKGQVRRDLQEVGFKVDRVKGPPGKREMLIAKKENTDA